MHTHVFSAGGWEVGGDTGQEWKDQRAWFSGSSLVPCLPGVLHPFTFQSSVLLRVHYQPHFLDEKGEFSESAQPGRGRSSW